MISETVMLICFSISLAAGGFWMLKDSLTLGLDRAAAMLGSSFFGRSHMVQVLIYTGVIILVSLVLFFILKKLSGVAENVNKTALILCFIIIFIMLAILCFEQTLRRDDYWEIHDSQNFGFPDFLLFEFRAINGRYFSLLLRSMYAFFDPEQYIHIALFINLILLFCVCTYLSHVCLDYCLKFHPVYLSFGCGMLLMMAALFVSPKIWEVWFWGSGTFVYGVGITLGIGILAFYLDACRGNAHIILTLICVTCACGCSELVAASVCAFGVGILIINTFYFHGRINKSLLIFTLWSLACVGFILIFSNSANYAGELSSGNSGSGNNLILHFLKQLPFFLRESFLTICAFFYSRLEYIVFLCGISFYLGTACSLKPFRKLPVFLGIILMFLTAIAVLTMNIFMHYIPGRVLNIPLLWCFLACSSLFFLLGAKVSAGTGKLAPMVCAILLCVPAAVLYKDSIPLLRNIYSGWHERDEMILSIKDKNQPITVCTIPVIGSYPWDLSDDPNFETNLVASVYYQVPQIIGGEPCFSVDDF